MLKGSDDEKIWEEVREFNWVPPGWYLVKIPITPSRIPALEGALIAVPGYSMAIRRYSCGGQQLWLSMADPPAILHNLLLTQGLSGMAILGPQSTKRLGVQGEEMLSKRIKDAVDPARRFAEI